MSITPLSCVPSDYIDKSKEKFTALLCSGNFSKMPNLICFTERYVH